MACPSLLSTKFALSPASFKTITVFKLGPAAEVSNAPTCRKGQPVVKQVSPSGIAIDDISPVAASKIHSA